MRCLRTARRTPELVYRPNSTFMCASSCPWADPDTGKPETLPRKPNRASAACPGIHKDQIQVSAVIRAELLTELFLLSTVSFEGRQTDEGNSTRRGRFVFVPLNFKTPWSARAIAQSALRKLAGKRTNVAPPSCHGGRLWPLDISKNIGRRQGVRLRIDRPHLPAMLRTVLAESGRGVLCRRVCPPLLSTRPTRDPSVAA